MESELPVPVFRGGLSRLGEGDMLSRGAEMPPRLRAGSAGQTKTAPVLRCQNLGIQFGGLKAVSDFNMEIGQSELVGLIGPNGAGKTTTLILKSN